MGEGFPKAKVAKSGRRTVAGSGESVKVEPPSVEEGDVINRPMAGLYTLGRPEVLVL